MTQAEAEWLLAECRRKIDALDVQLRDLLNQRAEVVGDVVRAKQILSMPVLEVTREEEVVHRAVAGNTGPLSAEAITQIFQAIMKEMRELQHMYLEKQGRGE